VDDERRWFVGTLAVIKIAGEAVGDRFALIEFLLPHHASPPLHTHPQDETYVVLEGELTLQLDEERLQLGTGDVAVATMGTPHSFLVESETARVVVLSTPAGLERMVRDGSVPATSLELPPAGTPRPTAEELARVFEAHGVVNLGPPLV
jgi:quercetin dioxygenase-like cupin family protein